MMRIMEKSCEFIADEDGAKVILRPMLPFTPEEFFLRRDTLYLTAPEETRVLRFLIPEEDRPAFETAETLTLIQFARDGSTPQSEIEISREVE